MKTLVRGKILAVVLSTYEKGLLDGLGAGFHRLGSWQLRQPLLQVIRNSGCRLAAAPLDVRLQGARTPVLAPAARSGSCAAICSAVPAAQGRGGTPLLPLRAANVNLNHGRTKCIVRTCKGKPSALHLPVCCTIATKATS